MDLLESSPEYLKWRNLIGDFMLEFASVEISVFGIIEDFGLDKDIQTAKENLFKFRAKLAIKIIKRKFEDKRLISAVENNLNEIMELADEVRNLIAHNPVELSIESIFSHNPIHKIRSIRDSEEVLTYEEILEEFKKLKTLHGNLFHATHKLRQLESWRRNKP